MSQIRKHLSRHFESFGRSIRVSAREIKVHSLYRTAGLSEEGEQILQRVVLHVRGRGHAADGSPRRQLKRLVPRRQLQLLQMRQKLLRPQFRLRGVLPGDDAVLEEVRLKVLRECVGHG